MKIISVPKLLLDPVYLRGLKQPLEDVAEILDEQDRHYHALALRETMTIIDVYRECLVEKKAMLANDSTPS